jgi:hypothetical protein
MKSGLGLVPGTDTAGRVDQAGKAVPFYPSAHDLKSARSQTSAQRAPSKRKTQVPNKEHP